MSAGIVYAITCALCGLARCEHRGHREIAFVRGVCTVRPARDMLTATTARPGTGRHRRRPRTARTRGWR